MTATKAPPTAEEEAARLRVVQIRRYCARAGLAALCILVLYGLTRIANRLEQGVRADCGFYLQIADLPKLTPYPSKVIVDLATAARRSYIVKGCPGTNDPESGGRHQTFPPPPPIYTPKVSPTPPRP